MAATMNDGRPIFMQVAEMLEDAILNGAYPEESQVPSITEISLAYNINPATALKGVNVLVEAGLLYKKRGVGMFVSEGSKEKLLQRRKERFYLNYIQPMVQEARHLGIAQEELVELMKRGRFDDGN